MSGYDRYRRRGPAMSIGECQAALEAARQETAELRESYLRVVAALENARKQTERDVAARISDRMRKMALSLLEVADNLERALHFATIEDALRPGVEATLRQLQTVLRQEGVTLIEVKPGEQFDPRLHEAVAGAPASVLRDTVAKVIQTGYMFEDQILRPARVIVALPEGQV